MDVASLEKEAFLIELSDIVGIPQQEESIIGSFQAWNG